MNGADTAYKNLIEKSTCILKDNINTKLMEVCCDGLSWIQLYSSGSE
jgi:hypothetical protein